MRTIVALLLAGTLALGACGDESTPRADGGRATYGVFLLTGDGERCDLVTRVVPEGGEPTSVQSALAALVAGPDGDDDDEGTTSMFTSATSGVVRSVAVRERTAYVDFEDFSRRIPNASASCGSQALLAQLDATVEQFPEIDRGVYSFDGDRAAFYEWLQLRAPEVEDDP